MKNDNKSIVGGGRLPTFDKDVVKELTECISTMCKLGFSPTVEGHCTKLCHGK